MIPFAIAIITEDCIERIKAFWEEMGELGNVLSECSYVRDYAKDQVKHLHVMSRLLLQDASQAPVASQVKLAKKAFFDEGKRSDQLVDTLNEYPAGDRFKEAASLYLQQEQKDSVGDESFHDAQLKMAGLKLDDPKVIKITSTRECKDLAAQMSIAMHDAATSLVKWSRAHCEEMVEPLIDFLQRVASGMIQIDVTITYHMAVNVWPLLETYKASSTLAEDKIVLEEDMTSIAAIMQDVMDEYNAGIKKFSSEFVNLHAAAVAKLQYAQSGRDSLVKGNLGKVDRTSGLDGAMQVWKLAIDLALVVLSLSKTEVGDINKDVLEHSEWLTARAQGTLAAGTNRPVFDLVISLLENKKRLNAFKLDYRGFDPTETYGPEGQYVESHSFLLQKAMTVARFAYESERGIDVFNTFVLQRVSDLVNNFIAFLSLETLRSGSAREAMARRYRGIGTDTTVTVKRMCAVNNFNAFG